MQLEITETHAAALPRENFLNIRWGAIFGGLAVGLAASILLMLLGTAAGLSLLEMNVGKAGSKVPLAASIWNVISMALAAFVGGYVAARGSGLKRTSDGFLHAAVAWGMTLVLAVFMASSVTGTTFNAILPSLQGRAVQEGAQLMGSLDGGDRQAAAVSLELNLGISSEQAHQLIDQALALSGRESEVGESGRAAARETLRTAAVISLWLTASTFLSLAAALGGGASGIRNARRVLHRHTTTIS